MTTPRYNNDSDNSDDDSDNSDDDGDDGDVDDDCGDHAAVNDDGI